MLDAMREGTRVWLGWVVAALALPLIAAGAACAPEIREFPGTGGNGTGGTGTTGTTGTTGGSGTTSCEPGTQVECYTGPAGTKNVGICKAGKATCGPDGKAGACEGEVVPSPAPDCKAHQDQDCNGAVELCTLDLIWGASYGAGMGAGFVPPSLGVDPSGNIAFATYLQGAVDFGTGPLTSGPNDADIVVAKIDPAGKTLWARKIGDMADQQVNSTKVDAQGNILIAGEYDGTLAGLGIVVPPAAGGSDAFVAKLDPNGNPVWARWGGDPGYQTADAIAVSKTGEVVVAGTFEGAWSWNGGGAPLDNTSGSGSVVYVQRFDANGNAMWTVALSNSGGASFNDQGLYNIAIDGNDDVVLTGDFNGNIVFPDGTGYASQGNADLFVLKLHGKTGQQIWARTFGGIGDDRGYGIAPDSQGNLVVSGTFEDTLSLDGNLLSVSSGFTRNVFLAKFAPGGQVTWARTYGGGTGVVGMFCEIAENDSIVLVGAYDGDLDFGGGHLPANTTPAQFSASGFLAKLDANGQYIAARAIYAAPTMPGAMMANLAIVYRAAVTPGTHEIVTAGLSNGMVDLGGGLIGKADITSPFVGKYVP